MRFETGEPFMTLNFDPGGGGSGEPQITETTDTETADMGAQLYSLC
jgi:hypothetical protein